MGVLCFFGIALLACVAQAQLNNEIAPIPYSVRANFRWSTECGADDKMKCSDCNNIQKCNNGHIEYSVKCGDQFPKQPFCDSIKNECVADKNKCLYDKSDSVCPSMGIWPDLTDCKKYIACSDEGRNGIAYNCLYTSIYNHAKQRCVTGAACYTVTAECGGKRKVIAYGPDKHLYVICKGTDLPELRACGNAIFNFNATSMECEFQCTEEGNFVHTDDNNKYYVCVKNGNNLVKVEQNCPANSVFNGNGCVAQDNTGNIVTTDPDDTDTD